MIKTQTKTLTLIRLLRPLLHFFTILGIYYIAYYIRSHTNLFLSIDIATPRVAVRELQFFAFVSACVFVLTGIVHGRYELLNPTKITTNKDFLTVRGQWLIISTGIAYFGQGFFFQSGISRLIILNTLLLVVIIIPLIDLGRNAVMKKVYRKFPQKILFLLENDSYDTLLTQLKLPDYYHTQRILFSESDTMLPQADIIVLVGSFTKDNLQSLIDHIRLQDTQLYHIGDNYLLEDILYTHTRFEDIISIKYTSSQIEGRNAILKRLFDMIGSLIGIIITSPLMLVAAIAIKLDTKGPIFYRQERVGKNGKNFLFTKFRSMYTHLSTGSQYGGQQADKLYADLVASHANIRPGELPKIKNDPRVTPVGKRLRATSIDELPNLFAVLQGNMSLIGPRPHLPSEIENYKPRQRRVLSIKPGITGYAQIHGRDSLSFDEEATKELEYIQNRSLWLDIYIIFMTFRVLFSGRGK